MVDDQVRVEALVILIKEWLFAAPCKDLTARKRGGSVVIDDSRMIYNQLTTE